MTHAQATDLARRVFERMHGAVQIRRVFGVTYEPALIEPVEAVQVKVHTEPTVVLVIRTPRYPELKVTLEAAEKWLQEREDLPTLEGNLVLR